MPELVEDRHVLRDAPDERADEGSGQGFGGDARPRRRTGRGAPRPPARRSARRSTASSRGGRPRSSRRPRPRGGRRRSGAGCRASSAAARPRSGSAPSNSRVRNRTISFSVALLVTIGICTKLKRRLSAVESSFTPRSRALAVAMMLKPGRAKTTLSPFSSGIVMYFSERIEISASWTSLLHRVSSSNRPIRPCCMAVMIGEGIMLSRDWPAAMTIATFHEYLIWSSVVPAVPWTTWVLLPQIAAASSSASQLLPVPGSPIRSSPRSLARVTIARSTVPASPKNFGVIGRSELVRRRRAQYEEPDHPRRESPARWPRPRVDRPQPFAAHRRT